MITAHDNGTAGVYRAGGEFGYHVGGAGKAEAIRNSRDVAPQIREKLLRSDARSLVGASYVVYEMIKKRRLRKSE